MGESERAVRTAVVTGGSAGIGRAAVEVLLREGYRVAALARRAALLEPLAAAGVLTIVADVADEASVDAAARRVQEAFGALNALVNCAGIAANFPIGEGSLEQIRRILDVNLLGTVLTTRAMLPMIKAAKGAIINVSSGITTRPLRGTSVYAAAKGGIESFTRALALELGPDGVRVCAVAPSLVRSDIWLAAGMEAEAYERMLEARGREYPLGRVGEPEDVAEFVAYLVSPRAAWVTGAVIPIDGGSTLGIVRR
jgi:NAD(P)-dependent dehydrogenase (short-subunit alcohol dehydrogenase family)